MITPLPIHFKKPGRSYSQIGRKGNVALYSVYCDYLSLGLLKNCPPLILIGFELIVIKIRNGREHYPNPSEFGRWAWSIPKSFSPLGRALTRCRGYVRYKLRKQTLVTFLDRSPSSKASTLLATV